MLILMSAALAAAQPAPAVPAADSHGQHMAMPARHEQMKCCDCCKEMAKMKAIPGMTATSASS